MKTFLNYLLVLMSELREILLWGQLPIMTVNLDVTKMTYRLVQMEGVHFENGGKNTFAKVETKEYGEENLKDAYGNVIMVRTSSYASFAAETLLC